MDQTPSVAELLCDECENPITTVRIRRTNPVNGALESICQHCFKEQKRQINVQQYRQNPWPLRR